MPNMISLRNFRLATISGHVIEFEAKVPTYVPDVAVSDAMAAGCVPEHAEETPFFEVADRAKVEFTGGIRNSMLYMAIKSIAERNDAKEFDGGGNPKESVVSSRLGFDVSKKEVIAMYQQYQQVTAENLDFPVHPAADNIMRVINAETKAELVELALEFGLPEAKAKGLVIRDLRKLLLVKLEGNAA